MHANGISDDQLRMLAAGLRLTLSIDDMFATIGLFSPCSVVSMAA